MKTIARAELKKKIDEKNAGNADELVLINTLPKDHFSKTRIPGAINIPEQDDDFVERVSSAVGDDLNAEIIVYCASSECDSSTNAAQKLDSAGFTNVYEYEGGAKDWQRASPSPQMSG